MRINAMKTNNKTAIAMMIEHDARSISIVSGEGDGPGTDKWTKSRTVILTDIRKACGMVTQP